MDRIATTKLSSRGQVVIPEEIRTRLGLEAGAQFVVLGEGDTVILKAIRAPDWEQFDELLEQARAAAARAGMTEEDIRDALRRVRKKK